MTPDHYDDLLRANGVEPVAQQEPESRWDRWERKAAEPRPYRYLWFGILITFIIAGFI